MIKLLVLVAVASVIFILLDLLWFSLMGGFFRSEIGSIARLSPNGEWNVRILPAVLVYVLMAVGLVALVLPQAVGLPQAALFGALFGFVAYGIYDLTNLATLSAWTWRFSVVDMTWGTVLVSSVSSIGFVLRKFLG